MNWDWKEWALAALIRALKTFAQCFAASIGTGMVTVQEVDWLRAASVSFVAFFSSMLPSPLLFFRRLFFRFNALDFRN